MDEATVAARTSPPAAAKLRPRSAMKNGRRAGIIPWARSVVRWARRRVPRSRRFTARLCALGQALSNSPERTRRTLDRSYQPAPVDSPGAPSPMLLSRLIGPVATLLASVVLAFVDDDLAIVRSMIFPASQEPCSPSLVRAGFGPSFATRPPTGSTSRARSSRRPSAERLVVLYFHGNVEAAAHNLPLADALRAAGLGVFLAEYRGYGGLPGAPSEKGLYAMARRRSPSWPARPPARVVLVGRSLGSGVAVELATRHRVAAIVLVSAYMSIVDVGRTVAGPLATLVIRDRFDSLSKIARVASPVALLHGTRDDVVPVTMGRRLAAARPGPVGSRYPRRPTTIFPASRISSPARSSASSPPRGPGRSRRRARPRATIPSPWARSRRLPDRHGPPGHAVRHVRRLRRSGGPPGRSPCSRSAPSQPSYTSAGPATFPTSPSPRRPPAGPPADSSASPVFCTGTNGCLVVYVAPWCGPRRSSLPGDVALADHIRTKGYETAFSSGWTRPRPALT